MSTFDQIGKIADRVIATAEATYTLDHEREYKGGVITAPGIYRNVPIEDYHHNTSLFDRWSISSSGLKQLIERPSLYWANSPYNDNPFPKMPTKEMEFGKAAHVLILGEDTFSQSYVLQPKCYTAEDGAKKPWSNNANACKEWKAEQIKAGRAIITADALEKIKWMADSLSRHPIIQAGALNGKIERTMIGHIGSIAVRSRPDVIPADSSDFADFKTAQSVDHDALQKAIFNSGLHIQAAVVRMVSQLVMPAGWQFGEFLLVFVEKTPPFDVVPVVLKTTDIDLGERQARSALKTLERCILENRWPGATSWDEHLGFVEMPSWAKTRIENELTGEAA